MLIKQTEPLRPTGRVDVFLQHAVTGEIKHNRFYNVVTTLGVGLFLDRLTGGGNDCELTYAAVGTAGTTPTIADTALGTELARKLLTSRSYAGRQAQFTIYFSTGEANGAIAEFGLFGDGASATPDSGVLFNRTLLSVTKTSSYTMTIIYTLSLS